MVVRSNFVILDAGNLVAGVFLSVFSGTLVPIGVCLG